MDWVPILIGVVLAASGLCLLLFPGWLLKLGDAVYFSDLAPAPTRESRKANKDIYVRQRRIFRFFFPATMILIGTVFLFTQS